MDTTPKANVFNSLPSEVLVDILLLTNQQTIVQFASVNSAHLQLFNRANGLWQQITCKIFHWGNSDIKKVQEVHGAIDWKKEFRVTSFYDEKIRNNCLLCDERQEQAKCLTKIAENHFKFYKEVDTYDFEVIYFSLQSQTRLYPHPIGNFTVAYFEIELLEGASESTMVTIGAALEGYVDSLPGIGRNSYGYCSDGRVGLECELAREDVPIIEPGNFAGFGINFEKSSIFFTKNGQVVKEVAETYVQTPIMHIKALYATVGFVYDPAIKVNFGSKPFKFDILKYQQQNCNTAQWSLYSQKMRAHVTADSMSEAIERYTTVGASATLADYNVPKSIDSTNPFLYMITYQRLPPDWQGEPVPPMIFQTMRLCQAIFNCAPFLSSLGDSPITVSVVKNIADRMGFESENIPWEELVETTIDRAYEVWFQQLLSLLGVCAKDLDEMAFENHWACGALALHLFALDIPTEHYAIQAAAKCMQLLVEDDPTKSSFNFEEVTRFGRLAFQSTLLLRPMAGLHATANTAREQLARQEKDAIRVFGPDKELQAIFYSKQATVRGLQAPKQSLPLGYKRKFLPLMWLVSEALGITHGLLLHGLYGRGISIENLNTLEDFLNEVRQIELREISPELVVEYAESCLEDIENYTDEEIPKKIGPLVALLNFKSTNPTRSTVQSFLKRLILTHTKKGKLEWLKSAISSRWVVGVGVAIIASVAAYWTRKKLTQ